MSPVHFYHLTTTPLERALPKLLEKSCLAGYRTLLLADDIMHARLDEMLWTYDPASFLPHGVAGTAHDEAQPILITTSLPRKQGVIEEKKCDNTTILLTTNGYTPETLEGFNRIIDLFNGNDDAALASARNRWKQYKDQGQELAYWKQTATGGWERSNG